MKLKGSGDKFDKLDDGHFEKYQSIKSCLDYIPNSIQPCIPELGCFSKSFLYSKRLESLDQVGFG